MKHSMPQPSVILQSVSRSIFLLSILLMCCSPSDSFTDDQKAVVSSDVRTMLDAYFSDIASEGLRAEFRYLENSEDFFWVPPGYSSALTYDSVRTILEESAGMFCSVEFSWDTLRIVPLSYNLATYTGRVRSMMVDTTGTMNIFRMLETGLVRRDANGRWWILSGQSRTVAGE